MSQEKNSRASSFCIICDCKILNLHLVNKEPINWQSIQLVEGGQIAEEEEEPIK